MKKKVKDTRKRLLIALNLSTFERSQLEVICQEENRTITQQIELWVRRAMLAWFGSKPDEELLPLLDKPEFKHLRKTLVLNVNKDVKNIRPAE